MTEFRSSYGGMFLYIKIKILETTNLKTYLYISSMNLYFYLFMFVCIRLSKYKGKYIAIY